MNPASTVADLKAMRIMTFPLDLSGGDRRPAGRTNARETWRISGSAAWRFDNLSVIVR
jgi:hypothetical protein